MKVPKQLILKTFCQLLQKKNNCPSFGNSSKEVTFAPLLPKGVEKLSSSIGKDEYKHGGFQAFMK